MTRKPRSLLERILGGLRRRRSPQVLVWVNTVHGPRAVPMTLRDLR